MQSENVRSPGGCVCSDFTWFRRGSFTGDCRAVDRDGLRFCYVHQPNRCLDALPSSQFLGMEVSKVACRCSRTLANGLCAGAGSFRDALSGPNSNEAKQLLADGKYFDPLTNETLSVVDDHEY